MHNKRLKIFGVICGIIACVCVARLGYMQLNPKSAWQGQLEKIRRGASKQLPALRGEIVDRKGRIVAADEAKFTLCIDYKYARLADERFWRGETLAGLRKNDSYETVAEEIKEKYSADYAVLFKIIEKCAHFQNKTFEQAKQEINDKINSPLWRLRHYIAWKRKYPTFKKFELAEPNADKRLMMARAIDLAEMHEAQKLFGFENDDDVLAGRVAFINTPGISILPRPERFYPYESAAAQLIGWVRPWDEKKDDDFSDDDLARYQHGDVAGFSGVEYVCESVLRGRRGRIVYNIDKEIVSKTETKFGNDIAITIDIELQSKIEKLLANKAVNNYADKPSAAIVIDVNSGDVLAMASMPVFDLNGARRKYGRIINDPNKPTLNRAINKRYPPGSTIKPIMLVIGIEEGKGRGDEIINCTARPAKKPPRCWYEKRFHAGHDDRWAYDGGNNGRNAIRGSCNIYFSHLAARIKPVIMQRWLWDFGFGHESFSGPEWLGEELGGAKISRNFQQTTGIISSSVPNKKQLRLEQLPRIDAPERRFFGIGQGNFRATPMQVANAFATIARGGVYKEPRIFITTQKAKETDLQIKRTTLAVVRDGMAAVVNEAGGTANRQFANSGFDERNVNVFGKTGSTERPSNAWFAGFAEDDSQRAIAIAVIVEGGQHGSSDAGPLGRDIISLCIEEGYLGD